MFVAYYIVIYFKTVVDAIFIREINANANKNALIAFLQLEAGL